MSLSTPPEKARARLPVAGRIIGLARKTKLFGLARDRSGATAVEFALIGAPFFAMMLAILQTGIIFFAGQVLETAVADSSRLIMTGQAQQGNFDAAAFKTKLCSEVAAIFDCANGIYVDVRKASNFSAADLSAPLDASGNFTNNFMYQPGGPGDIVVVRVVYQWPVITGPLGLDFSNMAGGKRLLMAAAAFRNEPF